MADKRLKMSLNERTDCQSNKIRDSFDDRVCDDLSEVLLKYLPIEERFKLEGVSKQFQRTVFSKQFKLHIIQLNEEFESDLDSIQMTQFVGHQLNDVMVDTTRLTAFLKKCQNINELIFGYFPNPRDAKFENMDQVLQIVVKYCHRLTKIGFRCYSDRLKTETIESFVEKFRHQIKDIVFPYDSSDLFRLCESLAKNCSNPLSLTLHNCYPFNENHEYLPSKVVKLDLGRVWLYHFKHNMSSFDVFAKQMVKRVTHLNLKLFDLQTEEAIQVLESLSSIESLKQLVLHFKYDITSFHELTPGLASIGKKCRFLHSFELIFSSSKMNENSFDFLKYFHNLKRLSIDYRNNSNKNYSFNCLKSCSQLTSLKLTNINLSYQFFQNIDSIVTNLVNFEIINRRLNASLADNNIRCISSLKKLKSLKIDTNTQTMTTTVDDINYLVNNSKKLQTIRFENMLFKSITYQSMYELENNSKVDISFIDCQYDSDSDDSEDYY